MAGGLEFDAVVVGVLATVVGGEAVVVGTGA